MEGDHRKRQEKIGRTFSFFSLCFGNEYDVQDLSTMSENMLGEAKDLGLGGVWLGGYPKVDRVEWLKKYFDLPEHIKPYSDFVIWRSDKRPCANGQMGSKQDSRRNLY